MIEKKPYVPQQNLPPILSKSKKNNKKSKLTRLEILMDKCLDSTVVKDLFKISSGTLRKWVKYEGLAVTVIRGRSYYDMEDIEAMMAMHKSKRVA